MCINLLGQAFYVGGSERSGQQIIEPPKRQDNDKKVTEVFEAARKQGATQAQDEKSTLSSRREEKPFTDAGRSLGNISRQSYHQLSIHYYSK